MREGTQTAACAAESAEVPAGSRSAGSSAMAAESTQAEARAQGVRTLFNPRSIALIGATDKSVWSASIYANLLTGGFPAEHIHLINPHGVEVHGQPTHRSILDLPEVPDMAFVMVSAAHVIEVMEQTAQVGTPTAVVLTSGFGEVGDEGAALEEQLLALARNNGITLLGPNGNGYVNAAHNTVPYGLPITEPLEPGAIGIALQSGALASAVVQQLQTRNAGLSLLVSMGNESMVSLTDVMEYLIADEATKVITLFIESIRQPQEFLRVARLALEAGKPIVALKVGRSATSAKVAKAHTGSLVGDDAVIEAVFRRTGVIRVDSLEDLIITSELLATAPLVPGPRLGFVTASGGACELIADRAAEEGIEIPDFTAETNARLAATLPEFAAARNPIDVTGYILVDGQLMIRALDAIKDDPNIDGVVVIGELPHDQPKNLEETIERFSTQAEYLRAYPKPLIMMSNSLVDVTAVGRQVASASGYPAVTGGIYHGMSAIGRAIKWADVHRVARTAAPAEPAVPLASGADGFAGFAPAPGEVFAEYRASRLLAAGGVPVVPGALVHSADEAATAAVELGYPVVVKLSADEVEHKSDIGGVQLRLNDEAAVREAYTVVTAAGRLAGVQDPAALVQPQREEGTELIVGVVRDPVWGQVLAVGLGGVWVEVVKDTSLHLLPVSREQVKEGLLSLRGHAVLDGVRGGLPADLDAITDVVVRIADLAVRLEPLLESLEVNPLQVRGDRVEALDALIVWK